MIPKLKKRHNWFDSKAELKEGDAIYFRKFKNEFSSKWTVGKVSDVVKSKDGVVGRCTIQYQNSSEDQPSYTDKAARSAYKFPNMLNKSLNEFEDFEQVMLNTLPLMEDRLMSLLCAVNIDFTGMKTEPDALVDSSF